MRFGGSSRIVLAGGSVDIGALTDPGLSPDFTHWSLVVLGHFIIFLVFFPILFRSLELSVVCALFVLT